MDLTVNTSFNGLEVVDIRTTPRDARPDDPGDAIADDAHDISFSRDGNTLYTRRARLDPDRRRERHLRRRARDRDGDDPQRRDRRAGRGRPGDPAVAPVGHELGRQGARHHRRGRRRHHRDALQRGRRAARSGPRTSGTLGRLATPASSARGSTRTRGCARPARRRRWPRSAAPSAAARSTSSATAATAAPGRARSRRGFDGVSRLPGRSSSPPTTAPAPGGSTSRSASSSTDGVAEDSRSTWGNTLGWNVMPGAETWSAKEYKGYVYTGDMTRGFDVFSLTKCEGVGCIVRPTNTPGRAKGDGGVEGERRRSRSSPARRRAARRPSGSTSTYLTGQAAPAGQAHVPRHARRTGR